MKTKYKFIHFELFGHNIVDGTEREVWVCNNNIAKHQLCSVAYYKEWKQYVIYDIETTTVFNNQCLRDIADFLDQLNRGDDG